MMKKSPETSSLDSPKFIVLLQDGDAKRKLRFGENDLSSLTPSGHEVALAILAHSTNTTAELTVYDSNLKEFVLLDTQKDVAKELGRRLLCQTQSRPETAVLEIQGRHFSFDDGMTVANKRVRVHEMPNIPGAGTGLNVWDGAVLMVKYLEKNSALLQGKSVLEFGSGCGLVGIAAALLGAKRVILSDLPYTMDLMRSNVSRNQLHMMGDVECRFCDWLQPPVFDDSWNSSVLLIADCVWVEELVPPLLATISSFLLSCSGCVHAVVSYQRRGRPAHDLFWSGMQNLFDTVRLIDCSMIEKPDSLNIYECEFDCKS
jgi:hypothetical protein